MFGGTDALPPADQLNRIADAAVDMFLATYGQGSVSSSQPPSR